MLSTRFFFPVALLGALLFRVYNITADPNLWLDEIYSVAAAESGLFDLVLGTLRFDTHPPLYYMALWVWSLFGQSDQWYLIGTVTMSFAAAATMYLVARHHFGRATAEVATIIYLFLPMQLFFAENVRMYTFTALLSLLLWHVLRTVEARSRRRSILVCGLLGACVTLSHGLGFFVAFWIFLAAFVSEWTKTNTRAAWTVLLSYLSCAWLALYSLIIGSFRGTVGMEAYSFDELVLQVGLSFLGLGTPIPLLIGFALLILLLAFTAAATQARHVALFLFILPVVTLLVISVTVKPILFFRTISLFHPFLALAIGICLTESTFMSRRVRAGVGTALALVLVFSCVTVSVNYTKQSYMPLTQKWLSVSEEDDVLVTSSLIGLSGVARYAGSTSPRSILDVQFRVRGG